MTSPYHVPGAMSSIVAAVREDLRKKKLTKKELRVDEVTADIAANAAKYIDVCSLTDQRTWLHFASQVNLPLTRAPCCACPCAVLCYAAVVVLRTQHSALKAVRALIGAGADVNARDLVGAARAAPAPAPM